MTQDIIRMAREAGFYANHADMVFVNGCYINDKMERFFRLAYEAGVAAEREKLAHWMRNCGYATGHGDTIEDLLDHLGTQIASGLEAEVLMEREACAKVAETTVCDTHLPTGVKIYGSKAAAAIRARSKT